MAQKSELQKKIELISIHGTLSAAIALGERLHLFEALAKVGSDKHPATAAQVAEASGCKERYVKEWLCTMATGELIEVNEDENFWIKKENVADLTSSKIIQFDGFQMLLKRFDSVCEVFRKEGLLGLNYTDYEDFYNAMALYNEAFHRDHFISDFIPALGSGLKERLENGDMMCLDVGCGNGFHAALLAKTFPKSNFTGIDITLEAVHLANQQRNDNGESFDNLAFILMDSTAMDADWNDKYDMITMIDACHEQMRPDLCLKEVFRVLKKGGVFGMLEIQGTSNVYTDRKQLGILAAKLYGISVFHCLPVGSNSPDALGLGAMWGEKKALELLKDAGFTSVIVVPAPQFPSNLLYVCKK